MDFDDEYWMRHALRLARYAEVQGEVPVGAVLVKDNQLVAEGWNQPIMSNDPTAHAEIVVIRSAAKSLSNYRIPDCVLYTTLEPCLMCLGAILHARINKLVFGARDERNGDGGTGDQTDLINAKGFNRRLEITDGVLHQECSNVLRVFFQNRRTKERSSQTLSV
jgi:tRNA(adenine34) deaminase